MASILTERNPVLSTRRRAVFRMRASASLSLGRPRMGFRRLAESGMSCSLRSFCIFTLHRASNVWRGNVHSTRWITGQVWSFFCMEKSSVRPMTHLFDPLAIRDITFANRVFVSPMCQYSSTDGYANDWHFVHLGSRAVGGARLGLTERTAVLPEGRISPQDLGIWADAHIEMLTRIVSFIHDKGASLECNWRMPGERRALGVHGKVREHSPKAKEVGRRLWRQAH